MAKLSPTKIDKHKPTKNDESLADGNGLYIRFRKGQSGNLSRMWIYTYKIGTKSCYITLGDHDASLPDFVAMLYKLDAGAKLTLANARKMAVELTDWRKKGINPKAFMESEVNRLAEEASAAAKAKAESEEQIKKQFIAESLTVQAMFNAWIIDGVRRKDGNAELQRSFKADLLPRIGATPIKDLTEHDLRGALREMVGRGVNRAAVVMRNNLTQMFAWAEKRQPWRKLLIDGNPMDLIDIDKIVSPDYDMDNERNRILSTEEIQELRDIFGRMQAEYEAAPNKRSTAHPIEQTVQRAVWIMLSTMCRVGEMSMARWDHINFNAGEWFIPKENVKDCVSELTVYLSNFALDQFRQLRRYTGHSEWCFPARYKEGHVCVKSMSKQVGDRQAMFKKGNDGNPRKQMKNRAHNNTLVLGAGKSGAWTPHDLRRTGATLMQSLGIHPLIIGRCQNHVIPGSKVQRHYLFYKYANENRQAWKLLGDRLSIMLNPAASNNDKMDALIDKCDATDQFLQASMGGME